MQFEAGPVARYFEEHGTHCWTIARALGISRARLHLFIRGDDRSLGKAKRDILMQLLTKTPQQLGRDRARIARQYEERAPR